MCYDLLEIKKDVYRYVQEKKKRKRETLILPLIIAYFSYVYTNNAGEEHEKEVLIGETDQLWPIVRHKHIAETINYVINNFNEFVRTNKAAELKNKPKEVVELKEMSEVMRTMPQFQELLNKVILFFSSFFFSLLGLFFRSTFLNSPHTHARNSTLFTSTWQINA